MKDLTIEDVLKIQDLQERYDFLRDWLIQRFLPCGIVEVVFFDFEKAQRAPQLKTSSLVAEILLQPEGMHSSLWGPAVWIGVKIAGSENKFFEKGDWFFSVYRQIRHFPPYNIMHPRTMRIKDFCDQIEEFAAFVHGELSAPPKIAVLK